MIDIFYMILGVGIFAAVVAHAFASSRHETRNTPSPRDNHPASIVGIPWRTED